MNNDAPPVSSRWRPLLLGAIPLVLLAGAGLSAKYSAQLRTSGLPPGRSVAQPRFVGLYCLNNFFDY